MKKFLLIIFLMVGAILPQTICAQQIPMQIIDETPAGPGGPLAPPRPWYMTQNDYTLTMPAFEYDFTLVLLDEDGVVVYTTYVPAGEVLSEKVFVK